MLFPTAPVPFYNPPAACRAPITVYDLDTRACLRSHQWLADSSYKRCAHWALRRYYAGAAGCCWAGLDGCVVLWIFKWSQPENRPHHHTISVVNIVTASPALLRGDGSSCQTQRNSCVLCVIEGGLMSEGRQRKCRKGHLTGFFSSPA